MLVEEGSMPASAVTDAHGAFSILNIVSSKRLLIETSAPGFGSNFLDIHPSFSNPIHGESLGVASETVAITLQAES